MGTSSDPRILTLKDLRLLHKFCEQQELCGYHLYILNHYQDISILSKLMPEEQCYGIIIQADPTIDIHKTPILVQGNKYLILDSLAGHPGIPQLKAAIQQAVRAKGEEALIFETRLQRQSDTFSCGSESFVVISEALKLGPELFELHARYGMDYTHPSIAKYTQGITRVRPLYKKGAKGTELCKKFPYIANQPIDSMGRTDSLNDFLNRHKTENGKYNLAVDQMRERHLARLHTIKSKMERMGTEKAQQSLINSSAFKHILNASTNTLRRLLDNEFTFTEKEASSSGSLNDRLQALRRNQQILITNYIDGDQSISLSEITNVTLQCRQLEIESSQQYRFISIIPRQGSFSPSNNSSCSKSSSPTSKSWDCSPREIPASPFWQGFSEVDRSSEQTLTDRIIELSGKK